MRLPVVARKGPKGPFFMPACRLAVDSGPGYAKFVLEDVPYANVARSEQAARFLNPKNPIPSIMFN